MSGSASGTHSHNQSHNHSSHSSKPSKKDKDKEKEKKSKDKSKDRDKSEKHSSKHRSSSSNNQSSHQSSSQHNNQLHNDNQSITSASPPHSPLTSPSSPDSPIEDIAPPRVDLVARQMHLNALLSSTQSPNLPTNQSNNQTIYWDTIDRFLRARISKSELDRDVLSLLGPANLYAHNDFFLALLQNAESDDPPPARSATTLEPVNQSITNNQTLSLSISPVPSPRAEPVSTPSNKDKDKDKKDGKNKDKKSAEQLLSQSKKPGDAGTPKEKDKKKKLNEKDKKKSKQSDSQSAYDSADELAELFEENWSSSSSQSNNQPVVPPTSFAMLDPTTTHQPVEYITTPQQFFSRMHMVNEFFHYRVDAEPDSWKQAINPSMRGYLPSAKVQGAAMYATHRPALQILADEEIDDDSIDDQAINLFLPSTYAISQSLPNAADIKRRCTMGARSAGLKGIESDAVRLVEAALKQHVREWLQQAREQRTISEMTHTSNQASEQDNAFAQTKSEQSLSQSSNEPPAQAHQPIKQDTTELKPSINQSDDQLVKQSPDEIPKKLKIEPVKSISKPLKSAFPASCFRPSLFSPLVEIDESINQTTSPSSNQSIDPLFETHAIAMQIDDDGPTQVAVISGVSQNQSTDQSNNQSTIKTEADLPSVIQTNNPTTINTIIPEPQSPNVFPFLIASPPVFTINQSDNQSNSQTNNQTIKSDTITTGPLDQPNNQTVKHEHTRPITLQDLFDMSLNQSIDQSVHGHYAARLTDDLPWLIEKLLIMVD